jgi:lysophospholipase
MIIKICLLILLLHSWSSQALSEKRLVEELAASATPLFTAGKGGEFPGQSGIPIAYRYFLHDQAVGSVVLVNGYTENFHKYSELVFDLWQKGYSVFVFDHRGQGYSGRLLGDRRRGEMDDFENYVLDLKAYYNRVVKFYSSGPIYFVGHSLGGAIAARYLERYPTDIRAAVLSAPMLRIALGGWDGVTKFVVDALSWVGLGTMYVRGPRDPVAFPFGENKVTHSRARYDSLYLDILKREPGLALWGNTANWVRQAVRGTERVREEAGLARTPVLIFQAAQDAYVVAEAENDFCRQAGSACRVQAFAEARHEIFMESDNIRDQALASTFDFLSQNP